MARSAIQLYTLRTADAPLTELLARVADAGFEGVEYAGRIGDADHDAVVKTLDETGLDAAGAHVDIDRLEDRPEETIEFYRALGCEHLVVPWLDPECFRDVDAVEATADRLQSVAETVENHDVRFSYHNHDHEFVDVGGRTAFDRLADATTDSVGFEVDCGWATVGGVDPTVLLGRLGDRVSLVHVSDADEAGTPMEVGDGVLDVSGCAKAVSDHDVEWAIYEHDEPTDIAESIAHGASVVTEF